MVYTKSRTRPKVSLSISQPILNQLEERSGNRSAIIDQTLIRALDLFDKERRRLKKQFSAGDIEAITNTAKDYLERDINGLLGSEFDLAGKIRDEQLAERIAQLTESEQLALLDTIERWWNNKYRTGIASSPDGFFD